MKKYCFFIVFLGSIPIFTGCDSFRFPFTQENRNITFVTGDSKSVMKNADSPEDYTIYTADEKRNNPEAGDPDYIYLIMGKEGVIIEGPTIDVTEIEKADELFLIDKTGLIEFINSDEYAYRADGIRAIFNKRFKFEIMIDDFEYEISLEGLSEITILKEENLLKTAFTFLAIGNGGVAIDITINAIIDNEIVATSIPVTIEVR